MLCNAALRNNVDRGELYEFYFRIVESLNCHTGIGKSSYYDDLFNNETSNQLFTLEVNMPWDFIAMFLHTFVYLDNLINSLM